MTVEIRPLDAQAGRTTRFVLSEEGVNRATVNTTRPMTIKELKQLMTLASCGAEDSE